MSDNDIVKDLKKFYQLALNKYHHYQKYIYLK